VNTTIGIGNVARRLRSLFKTEGFRDAPEAPEMMAIPTGEFVMGSKDDPHSETDEVPARRVRIEKRIAVGRFPVTFANWDACVARGAIDHVPSDAGWGRGGRPVINVSFDDAKRYCEWLSNVTGFAYRLLTEAEWEYCARAGSTQRYPWGSEYRAGMAHCVESGSSKCVGTVPTGEFAANAFGLHDMLGNVWEWVEDPYHANYIGAPNTGDAWMAGGVVGLPVLRGGSWKITSDYVRPAYRHAAVASQRWCDIGFRVARNL
jgi:formylglycine-generating enzyme required for sulfatase activity